MKADEIVNVPGVPCSPSASTAVGNSTPGALGILERHPLTLVCGRVHMNETYRRP